MVYGPSGDPGAVVPPSEYTLVPWEDVKASKALASSDIDAIPRASHSAGRVPVRGPEPGGARPGTGCVGRDEGGEYDCSEADC